ncbi:aminotransferase class V-fold PLP-dependent enzyme [Bacillus sp. JCM 19041]|uniref:cysteine desulfurase family protein n=1 Tax=Bacillus sp. JCM 19041 TaxID=1460637 RepID=UPI0009EC641F
MFVYLLFICKTNFRKHKYLHTFGLEAATNLESMRTQFSSLIGLKKDEIYFTGSGSEANFLAIVSLALAYKRKGQHIISTKTEHPSVLNALSYLEKHGYRITYIPVTHEGTVTTDALQASIKPDTILCTIAAASSEIGTIQPMVELSTILRKHDILFHSDCIQALAKVPIDYTLLDAASFSAHKLYAPKGTGAAFISNRLFFEPFYEDARHEKGFRPGTVDLPAIASFTIGLKHAIQVQDLLMEDYRSIGKSIFEINKNWKIHLDWCH